VAGFRFDVPERYTPATREVPTAAKVAPWVETIMRLGDGPAFSEEQRRRCLAAAEAWRPERLLPRFEEFFRGALRAGSAAGPAPAPGFRVGNVFP
jgi:hypothetical protein